MTDLTDDEVLAELTEDERGSRGGGGIRLPLVSLLQDRLAATRRALREAAAVEREAAAMLVEALRLDLDWAPGAIRDALHDLAARIRARKEQADG